MCVEESCCKNITILERSEQFPLIRECIEKRARELSTSVGFLNGQTMLFSLIKTEFRPESKRF